MIICTISRSSGSFAGLRDEAEGREREALHHDLHAEVLHVPAALAQDLVEQLRRYGEMGNVICTFSRR
jgi:hypothetical protein